MSDSNKNYYPKFKNDYLLSIIILVDSEYNNIKTQLENLSSISKLNASIFEVIIYECEKFENKTYKKFLNKFKKEMQNLRVIKRNESGMISHPKAFIQAIELTNGKFVKMLRENDYLLKESFKLLLNIISHQTPDILVSNLMIFNEDDKEISPIHYFQRNIKEGILKKYDYKIFPSLNLITFRKSLLSNLDLDSLGDTPWIFRYIPMVCISKAETIYSTRAYMHVVRTSSEKRPLFQRVLSLKNKNNTSVILKMINDLDFSNDKTSKATRKLAILYIMNYLHYFIINDQENIAENYEIFRKAILENKSVKNSTIMNLDYKYNFYLVKNVDSMKRYNPSILSKKDSNVDVL